MKLKSRSRLSLKFLFAFIVFFPLLFWKRSAHADLKGDKDMGSLLLGAQSAPVLPRISLPRICLVYDENVFFYFEDWLNPLLFSLGMFFDVVKMPYPISGIRSGDTVLLLQLTHGLRKVEGVEYWFLNTEGPDKRYAELAIANGFTKIIDYDLYNTERLAANGADTTLWLPIIHPPTVALHTYRDKLCMIGGANTPRREPVYHKINRLAQERELPVSIYEVEGWGLSRDVVSQTCALVVNIASVQSNPATPRMRLDLLWLWDIPIISELSAGRDLLEYSGTVSFVTLEQLPGATLDLWENIMLQKRDSIASSLQRASKRQTVQQRRMEQYQFVVRSIASYALNRTKHALL